MLNADAMSGRVSKTRKSDTPVVSHTRLAKFIDKFGVKMPRCSACFRAGRIDCVVAEGKKRCGFCVENKYTKCDFGGVTNQACTWGLFVCLFVC